MTKTFFHKKEKIKCVVCGKFIAQSADDYKEEVIKLSATEEVTEITCGICVRQKVYDKAAGCKADLLARPTNDMDNVIMKHCVSEASASTKGAYRDTTHHIPWGWIIGISVGFLVAWNVWFL